MNESHSEEKAAALVSAVDTIRRIYWLSIREDQATDWFQLGGLPGILNKLVTAWSHKYEPQRVRIKSGWWDAGKTGKTLGDEVVQNNCWTPVLWDDEEDPTFHKTRGLDFLGPVEDT